MHHQDGGVSSTTLDITDIGAVYSRLVRKRLLAPPFLRAEPPHVFAKAHPNIHGGEGANLSTMKLQTMSDNRT